MVFIYSLTLLKNVNKILLQKKCKYSSMPQRHLVTFYCICKTCLDNIYDKRVCLVLEY